LFNYNFMSFFKKFNNIDSKRCFFSNSENKFIKVRPAIQNTFSGQKTTDALGFSIAMNPRGNCLIVGAPLFDSDAGQTNNVGEVRVYMQCDIFRNVYGKVFSTNYNECWILQRTYSGLATNDDFGRSVAIAGINGFFGQDSSFSRATMIAVGAPCADPVGRANAGCVKTYIEDAQYTSGICGSVAGEMLGSSISLNNEGNKISVGSPFANISPLTNNGCVGIYCLTRLSEVTNNSSISGYIWNKIGSSITGIYQNSLLGSSNSLNHQGNIIAIGAPGAHINSVNCAGYVSVYCLNSNETSFLQMGQIISGTGTNHRFATSICINDRGNIIAIGTTCNYVKTYCYDNNTSNWMQLGTDICSFDQNVTGFGTSISMNPLGNMIAIAAPCVTNSNYYKCAYVNLYSYNKEISNWQFISKFSHDTSVSNDLFGKSISLGGHRIAIGAPSGCNGRGYFNVYSNYTSFDDSQVWKNIGAFINERQCFAWGEARSLINSLDASDDFCTIIYTNALSYGDKLARIHTYNSQSGVWCNICSFPGFAATNVKINCKGNIIIFSESNRWNASFGTDYEGCLKAYCNTVGNTWVALSGLGNGARFANDDFCCSWGHSIDLNNEGDKMVVSAPVRPYLSSASRTSGFVHVYEYDNQSGWLRLGQILSGNQNNSCFGHKVVMNGIGDTISVLELLSSGTFNGSSFSGAVKTFKYNTGINKWGELGSPIYIPPPNVYQTAFSLNESGNVIAIGTPFPYWGAVCNPMVNVYCYNENLSQWTNLGTSICNYAMSPIVLNSSGNQIIFQDDFSIKKYKYDSTDWILDSEILKEDRLGGLLVANSNLDKLAFNERLLINPLPLYNTYEAIKIFYCF
jgi:hypothetical protein